MSTGMFETLPIEQDLACTHPRGIKVVKVDDVNVIGQGLEVKAGAEQGRPLDLRHGDIGHVLVKVMLGVQAEAFARLRSPCSSSSLHCLHPARLFLLALDATVLDLVCICN